jgi:hypothetical protein
MELIEYIKQNKPKEFKPRPFYSNEGDSLTFFFKDAPYYRERVDDFVTAYRAIDGRGLVGCQIKGLPAALKLLGNIKLDVSDGRVKLSMIFMALIAKTPAEQEAKERYVELGVLLDKLDASIPVDELPAAA